VVTKFRMAGTVSGVEVAQTRWQAVTLRDGKARWWAFFRTEREALEAAGLREQDLSRESIENRPAGHRSVQMRPENLPGRRSTSPSGG